MGEIKNIKYDVSDARKNHIVSNLAEDLNEVERLDLMTIRIRLYVEQMMARIISKEKNITLEDVEEDFEDYCDKQEELNNLYDITKDLNRNISKITSARTPYAHYWDLERAHKQAEKFIDDLVELNNLGKNPDAEWELSGRDKMLFMGFQTVYQLSKLNSETLQEFSDYGVLTIQYDTI